MKKIVLSLYALSLGMVSLQAADKTQEFVTHTEVGYIETSGNTDTKEFNLDSKVERAWDKHMGTFKVEAQYAKSGSQETKNKYAMEAEYDYMFSESFAFSYVIGYKSDKFSGFDYQVYTGPGIKYTAISQEVQTLAFDAGALYYKDNYIAGGSDSYAAYRFKALYNRNINENIKFAQDLELKGSFDDFDNYFLTSKSSLISKISDIFSAGISYKVDYAHLPVSGKDDTDTTLMLNLIMDY